MTAPGQLPSGARAARAGPGVTSAVRAVNP